MTRFYLLLKLFCNKYFNIIQILLSSRKFLIFSNMFKILLKININFKTTYINLFGKTINNI